MNCPICSFPKSEKVFEITDHLFQTTSRLFQIRQCQECRVLFLFPRPSSEDMWKYYPDEYWVGPGKTVHGLKAVLTEIYRRVVLIDHVRFVRESAYDLQRQGEPVKLLDVGCGDGSFLETCGIKPCTGLDASVNAVKAAKSRGIDAVLGSLDKSPFWEKSFSIITMFHFLEHVWPVENYLEAAKKLLADDGELILQVPNADSWQAGLLRKRWAGYEVPRHLINYSASTLTRVLQDNGFGIVRKTHFCLRDNAPMLARSLAPRLYPPARSASDADQKGFLAWISDIGFLGLSIGALPFAIAESFAGQGASVMVCAKKEC
ncbi:MAG: class I SAM-dependent methyltransferase [Desulfobacteraceae bacterium]|nr:class I SAM-dependent methyltransferase [Desulfobacteraceae bacterium]